ncbi:uncharacterized protein LOC136091617 isoform X2 [Hydra vulgaris]|uniref:Uncharacterized protein LOC136091617 isoform X2 n=2 Tax=Hydra vulgaris TaxID=6087 RepID=A0ABM4DLI2_HYDVU
MKLNKEMFNKLSDKLSFVNAAEINPYEALSSIDPLNSLTEIQFKKPGDDQSKDKRTPCHYQDCGQVFFQKVKLIKHIEECHEGIFFKESYNFLSESEFLAWKEKEELNSYVFFSKQSGSFFQ